MQNQTKSANSYLLFVGVDIAAASFVAATQPELLLAKSKTTASYSQSVEGFQQFKAALHATKIAPVQTLIVMEATGTYWISLATFLHYAGLAVAVVNPLQAHNFAKSLLQRNKNDQLDAQMLARFAQTQQPPAWTAPPAIYDQLLQRLVSINVPSYSIYVNKLEISYTHSRSVPLSSPKYKLVCKNWWRQSPPSCNN